MRQKVGFARALAVEPEMLCWTSHSAPWTCEREALRGELLELWTNQRLPIQAILMVSHNIEEAISMADRIVVMDKEPGRIVNEFRSTCLVRVPARSRVSKPWWTASTRPSPADRTGGAGSRHPPGAPGQTRLCPHLR
jgi:NitT/TauT family transport system ATP-binding protein